MAALDTTRTAYGTPSAVSRIFTFFGSIFGAIEAWQDTRMTRRALSELTDHELADLGIMRGDIDLLAESRSFR